MHNNGESFGRYDNDVHLPKELFSYSFFMPHASPIGLRGEDLAASFLEKKGYRIHHRNYFSYFGEIDIVASKDEEYVFVEVKTRSVNANQYISGEEAITYAKRKKMMKTIQRYFVDKNFPFEVAWRCDVVVVLMYPTFARIVHYPYAFENLFST